MAVRDCKVMSKQSRPEYIRDSTPEEGSQQAEFREEYFQERLGTPGLSEVQGPAYSITS